MSPRDLQQQITLLCIARVLVTDGAEMLHRDAGTCPSQLLPSPSVFQPAPGPPATSEYCLHPAHRQGLQILPAKPVPNVAFPGRLHQFLEGALLRVLCMVLSASGWCNSFSRNPGWKMLCFDEVIPERDQSVEFFG